MVMTSSTIRRRRGTPTVGVQVDIDPEVKALLDEYAAIAGVPQWAVIEAAIRAGRPGPSGLPDDWDLPQQLDLMGGAPVRRTA